MNTRNLISLWATLLLLLAAAPMAQAQKIFYVTTTGTAAPTSASTLQTSPSWSPSTSTTDLQGAINAATTNDQVWIAQGLYKPASSLQMKNGVAIYGGFVGNETALTARPAINPVNGNPSSTTISGDNNKRVFYNNSLNISAVLDGVIITAGSSDAGGGMYNDGSSPTLRNCSFQGNQATGGTQNAGGAMFNIGSTGTPAAPTLTNCSFQGNQATGSSQNFGGAMVNFSSNPSLTNCSFQGNQATGGTQNNLGGAMVNQSNSNPTLTNCILWNNAAGVPGGGNSFFNSSGGGVTARFSLFDASVTGYTGSNNLSTIISPFLSTTSVELDPASCAINTGDPNSQTAATGPYSATALPQTDLAGQPRIFGGRVDMGAVEFQAVGGPVASFTLTLVGSATATCAASPTITLNGSQTGVSYQLQLGGVNAGTALTGTGNALSFGPQSLSGTYSVLATNTTSSCSAVMEGSVTVVSRTTPPVASLSAISQTFCSGTTLTLVASGGVAYTFSTGANPTGPNTATVAQSGLYSVTVANADGCTSTTAFSVTVVPLASLVSQPVAVSVVCAGRAVSVPVSATGSGSLSYQWFRNGVSLGNAQNSATLSLPSTLTGDSGSYSLVVAGVCNSVTSTAFSLTVNPLPNVSISPGPSLTISNVQTATFTASGATSYTWSNQATTIQTALAGPYSVTGTDANGCSASASVQLSVTLAIPIIVVQPASASTVCEGASVVVSVSATGTVTGYRWLKGGVPLTGQTSAMLSLGNVQPGDAGVYSVSVTGPGGSTVSTGFTLTVNPLPVVTLLVPPSVTVQGPNTGTATLTLPPNSLTLTMQVTGGVGYERVFSDQANSYLIRRIQANTNGVFPLNELGPFVLRVTDRNGCVRTVMGNLVQTR